MQLFEPKKKKKKKGKQQQHQKRGHLINDTHFKDLVDDDTGS